MSTAAERAEIRPSEHALAWVFGQPVTDMPQDLFIPPDALKVVLHSFQGPLDLLLYLIRKQNIDVLDIPMMKITEQYLHYIAQMDTHQIAFVLQKFGRQRHIFGGIGHVHQRKLGVDCAGQIGGVFEGIERSGAAVYRNN